jgi:sugar phosphate isomerase/epimerase
MVLGSPQQRNRDPQTTSQVAAERAVQVVESLLPALEDTQVTLALEPLGPEETNFWNTAAEVREFIRIVDSPQLKLHLDVKAMSTESQSIAAILRESAAELVHFHANDPNRLGPGMGQIDYRQFWPTLMDIGYRGWISVEVFDFRPGPQVIAESSASYLRQL